MLFECQVFRHGEGHLRGDQTFHHRVVCQVQEHGHMVRHAAFFEGVAEEIRYVVFYAHGGKYDGEFFIGIIPQRRLLYDLGRQLVVGKSVPGEDRKLLPADQGGQSVDGGDAGADIVSRVLSAHRVERQAVHVPLQGGDDGAQVVDGLADAVEGAAQHIRGERDLHRMPGELRVCILKRHVFRSPQTPG